jgi:hypothetical protein
MSLVTPDALFSAFTATADLSAGQVVGCGPHAVSLEGRFDLLAIDNLIRSNHDPKIDIADAIEIIAPDVAKDFAELYDVAIDATLDFDRLAFAINHPDLAPSDLEFDIDGDAQIVYLVNAGDNYYPGEDNTLAIRHSREEAEKVADILRKRGTGGLYSKPRYDWVQVIPKKIDTVF